MRLTSLKFFKNIEFPLLNRSSLSCSYSFGSSLTISFGYEYLYLNGERNGENSKLSSSRIFFSIFDGSKRSLPFEPKISSLNLLISEKNGSSRISPLKIDRRLRLKLLGFNAIRSLKGSSSVNETLKISNYLSLATIQN